MKSILSLILILSTTATYSQVDSIFDQGEYRTFILHLPESYNPNNEYPLVLNLHGLGSSAFEQLLYSAFNEVADKEEFIVVYADAINNNWDLFGNKDVTFLSNLVDTIRIRYSTNECLFSMGMSQGGFLSYKLACELDHPLTAIANVTGNMLTFWQENCSVPDGMPVLHFHGTNDNVVLYNGSFGVSPVEETVEWWADNNGCNTTPQITSLPDIDPNDQSTAERHQFVDCDNHADVNLYKIINGGHTWPGAVHIPNLGVTNQDIDASALIGDFFTANCNSSTSAGNAGSINDILIYPNPVKEFLTITWPDQHFNIVIHDLNGRQNFSQKNLSETTVINCRKFNYGVYIVELTSKSGEVLTCRVIKSR